VRPPAACFGDREPSGHQGDDHGGRARHDGVGTIAHPRARAHGTVHRFDDHRRVSRVDLDGDRLAVRRAVDQVQLDRQREPVAAERIGGRRVLQQRRAPASNRLRDGAQLLAARRETNEHRRDGRRLPLPHGDAGGLELAQPRGEQVRRDPRQAVAQVGVAARPAQEQLADDEQRPAIADDVEGLRERAELAVGPHPGSLSDEVEVFT